MDEMKIKEVIKLNKETKWLKKVINKLDAMDFMSNSEYTTREDAIRALYEVLDYKKEKLDGM